MLTVDYLEQYTATGIKKNYTCPICKVPAKKRDRLFPDRDEGNRKGPPWPKRMHESSKRSIRLAETKAIKQASDKWIHPYEYFV